MHGSPAKLKKKESPFAVQLTQAVGVAGSFGSLPAAHAEQVTPSAEISEGIAVPAASTLHDLQDVAPTAASGWLPAAHVRHSFPSDEYCATQVSHVVRSALGSCPAKHTVHGSPLTL